MVTPEWRVRRIAMFPEIRDWRDAQDHLRYSTNVKAMTWKEWLWFHYTGYLLIYYGSPIISVILFLGLSLVCFLYDKNFISVILLVLGLLFSFDLGKKFKNRKTMKGMNLYDIFMRDD